MALEPGGDEEKEWLAEDQSAVTGLSGRGWWLFKAVKQGSSTGYRRSDDFSEKAVAELGRLIDVPVADVDLAVRNQREGVISHNVRPDTHDLIHGDILLVDRAPGYISCGGSQRPKNRVDHTLPNIGMVLAGMAGPSGPCSDWSAQEVFAGFLVLDAWVANTDRHALNWSVLERREDGERTLAPSFDHGSALGSGMADGDLPDDPEAKWCLRGQARCFENSPTLVDLAHEAIGRWGGRSQGWIDRLSNMANADLDAVLEGIPQLSPPRRTFIKSVLLGNQRRLVP